MSPTEELSPAEPDRAGERRNAGCHPEARTVEPPAFTGERVMPDRPELVELYREHLVRYLFATQLCRDRVVLDAGCGVGYGAELLGRAGARLVLGVDRAPDAIRYAQARYGSARVQFAVADCMALPVADGSVDLVVAFEVIEHLSDPAAFVREIARVLSSDGIAIISTPNRATFFPGNRFHVHEFDSGELEALLRGAFPHVEIWQQDVVQVHRIVPPRDQPSELPPAVPCATFDLAAPGGIPAAYFVALCSRHPIAGQSPAPTLLRTARDAISDLRAQVANLIGYVVQMRRQMRPRANGTDAGTPPVP
jgi:SAM-dependent methyltransferase